MKNTGIGTVVLLILQTLWLGTSHSADRGSPQFDAEISCRALTR